MFAASVRVPPAKIAATAKSRGACGPSFVFLARPRSCEALKSPRNATGIAMTNLHRSPPMNQSETDLGIVNESQFLEFGMSLAKTASNGVADQEHGSLKLSWRGAAGSRWRHR